MRSPNYRGAFLLGIILIALGSSFISLMKGTAVGPIFIGIGAIFMLYGARHKDQWQKKDESDTTTG